MYQFLPSLTFIFLLFSIPLCNASVSSTDSSGFVVLTDVVPEAIVELRYYTLYNFIGDRIRGYEEPVCLVTREAASALKNVNNEFLPLGYTIKVYDAYRPQMAVDHFVEWSRNLNDTRMQNYFYPEESKADLFAHGYISSKSGHSRGSTIDLTIYDLRNDCDVDMGGNFDYFGYRSYPDYPYITDQQKKNRQLLRSIMLKHGFRGIDTEWWHFTLIQEPYPYTYFTFPVKRMDNMLPN
jgi:D-alanyl-D-alanine dipeptidase